MPSIDAEGYGRTTPRALERATRNSTLIGGCLLAALLLIYGPSVGRGFVKDDFVWIERSRLAERADFARLLAAPTGFFRPVVSVSFAFNRAVGGLHPRGYGLTNLALLLVCAAGVGGLMRALGFSWPPALLAAAVWVFNFHGINAAVLWISGRTSLLLTAWATFGAAAFLKQRYVLASFCLLCALLSKEEAVALPLILAVWMCVSPGGLRSARKSVVPLIALATPLIVYLLLRSNSGALTPATAPSYYRFSFTVGRFLDNLPAYADRSMTFVILILASFALVARPRQLHLDRTERDAVAFGVLWLVCGFGPTIFLPARSSLYVCFPSVGAAVAGSAVATAVWRELVGRRRTLVVACGVIVPFMLLPIYRARNSRSVTEAQLSQAVLEQLAARVRGSSSPPTHVVVRDDRSVRPSLEDGFGTLIQVAADLFVNSHIQVRIEPPPAGADPASDPWPAPDLVLALKNGRLEPLEPSVEDPTRGR